MKKILLGMVLASCSGESLPDPDPWSTTKWDGLRSCSYELSPEPSLHEWTRRAAQRWIDTTECDLTVLEGSGGIPISYTAAIPITDTTGRPVDANRDGQQDMASGAIYPKVSTNGAFLRWEEIRVAEYASDPLRTLTHEIGHLLGSAELNEEIYPDSVMGGGVLIDEPTLSVVCKASRCPKSPPLPECHRNLDGTCSLQ